MKEISKYQCEHCNTVYDDEMIAMRCEQTHILFHDIVIVRSIHKGIAPAQPPEGAWPTVLIVGIHNNQDVLSRYKYEGEEQFKSPDMWGDQLYNPESK